MFEKNFVAKEPRNSLLVISTAEFSICHNLLIWF